MSTGPYECYCGETFKYQYGLKYHDNYFHNRAFYEKTCDRCNQVFMKTAKLKAHIKSNHEKNQNNFICENCGKCFKTKNTFQNHECPNGEKKHLCNAPDCNSAFSTRSDLRDHKKAFHFERKEYPCPDPNCEKIFYKRCWVRSHFALVHENIRQKCPIEGCNYQAAIIHYMRYHLKNHKELNPEDMEHYQEELKKMFKIGLKK